jgi:hypothetical protein
MLGVDCHFKLEGVGCFYELRSKTAFQSQTLTITIPKRNWTYVQFDKNKTEREAHFQFAALMRGWRAVRRKASLLRRERLLSILVGGSEKGDFGIRAVNMNVYRWNRGGIHLLQFAKVSDFATRVS